MPAVVTCDLRLNQPRYASLPGIMKAKKKELKEVDAGGLGVSLEEPMKVLGLKPPAERAGGEIVPDVPTLVAKLKGEAKVL